MKKPRLSLSAVILMITLSACINKGTTINVEGLWVSTDETSVLFEPWGQKVALLISRDSTKALNARGFFLKNGEFIADWNFTDVHYDPVAQKISLTDSDSDTLICILDNQNEMLKGAIHSVDEKNPLDFIRAGRNLENRILFPRVPDENEKIDYSCKRPEQTGDGLNTESIYNFSVDSSSVSNLMKEIIDQKYGRIKSLLILRNNKLIVEEYFYDYTRDDLQHIRSCTKSVTSLLLGIALDRHQEISIEQAVFDFFPQYDSLRFEGREEIRLKHILTMTAGLEWDDYPPEMYKTEDCLGYILSRPMAAIPGEKFNYNSGCSVLLGGIIENLEGKKPLLFAEEFLFTPLGITNYIWESHNSDILRCGEGLSLRPRDMAKIGLLVLNDGEWQDKQLVSKEWIFESTGPQVKESDFFDYGYQWWHHSKNNLQWWKEPNAASPEKHDLIIALGHGGQYIMIIRDLNLVVVTTASDFESGEMGLSKIPMVIEKIVPIFEETSF
ncbi:MAG: beta-lactamase family protein [Bacteroidetes bacterium]|nr:beta-lactamase family protein [Bacteroidota bacterium]